MFFKIKIIYECLEICLIIVYFLVVLSSEENLSVINLTKQRKTKIVFYNLTNLN